MHSSRYYCRPIFISLFAVSIALVAAWAKFDQQSQPHHMSDLLKVGVAQLDAREYGEAISSFSEVIERWPDHAAGYLCRSAAYEMNGEYDLAIQDCDRSIALDPDLGEAYRTRGVAFQEKGDLAKAKSDYLKAKQLGVSFE